MQYSKSYNFGKTREAGSLDTVVTNGRKLNGRTSLVEVERSCQHDDLFIKPVSEEPIEPPKKPVKKASNTSQNDNGFLDYDLDSIEVEKSQDQKPDKWEKKEKKTLKKRQEEKNLKDLDYDINEAEKKINKTENLTNFEEDRKSLEPPKTAGKTFTQDYNPFLANTAARMKQNFKVILCRDFRVKSS